MKILIEEVGPERSKVSSDANEVLNDEDGNYYQNEIYTQRFLPKWVYRGEEYTMVVVDTHVDGNKFLQIFTNANYREEPIKSSHE